MSLADRARELEKEALKLQSNIPKYMQIAPGVKESLKLTQHMLALLREVAEKIEQ